MIELSETARRTTLLGSPVSGGDGHESQRRAKYERARTERPTCTRCGARVSFDKIDDPYRQCEPCMTKTRERILSGEEQPVLDPDQTTNHRKAAGETVRLPNLYAYRKSRGWGRKTLGKRADVNENTVERCEKGAGVTLAVAEKLARALEVSEAELMEGTE